jgi:hypothetical protein
MIEAVQTGPAEFLVTAEQIQVGDEFTIGSVDPRGKVAGGTAGDPGEGAGRCVWLVIGDPVEVAPDVLLAPVTVTAGPDRGAEFAAHIRVGHRFA